MTESLERLLAERLQARPLPPMVPDLGGRSVRRGQRLRRRRVAGLVGVLVVLLTVPGITGSLLHRSSSDLAPVTGRSAVPQLPAAGPRAVILDPVGRTQRGEAAVATVRDRLVRLPSGAGSPCPTNSSGQ